MKLPCITFYIYWYMYTEIIKFFVIAILYFLQVMLLPLFNRGNKLITSNSEMSKEKRILAKQKSKAKAWGEVFTKTMNFVARFDKV